MDIQFLAPCPAHKTMHLNHFQLRENPHNTSLFLSQIGQGRKPKQRQKNLSARTVLPNALKRRAFGRTPQRVWARLDVKTVQIRAEKIALICCVLTSHFRANSSSVISFTPIGLGASLLVTIKRHHRSIRMTFHPSPPGTANKEQQRQRQAAADHQQRQQQRRPIHRRDHLIIKTHKSPSKHRITNLPTHSYTVIQSVFQPVFQLSETPRSCQKRRISNTPYRAFSADFWRISKSR